MKTNEAARPSMAARKTDPRWLRTRKRLLRIGFALLGEVGPEGIGIDEIIARAEISRQTFYNHFPDRSAFVQALWLESRHRIETTIGELNAQVADPAARLARAVAIHARLALDDPAHAQFVVRTLVSMSTLRDANAGLMQDLKDGVVQGRLSIARLSTAAAFVTGVTRSLISEVLDRPMEATVACHETILMLLLAMGCPAADCVVLSRQATTMLKDRIPTLFD